MDEAREFFTECVIAIWELLYEWRRDASAYIQSHFSCALQKTRGLLFAFFALFAAGFFFIFLVFCCLAASLLGALALRHYVLASVPGSQLFPLDLNTMPFATELWRLRRVDGAVQSNVIPLLDAAAQSNAFHSAAAEQSALVARDAAALKMSLIGRHVAGTVATGTLVIPSVVRREVFPPGGGVSLEALFRQRSPMFNARGTYHARAQLVFAREANARRVPMMLEASVLVAEDPHVPQALSTLDVLFKTTASFTLQTGSADTRGWLQRVFWGAVQMAFVVPLKLYKYVSAVLHNDVFPLIDEDTEVAAIVTVYDGFEPPDELQPRLRAINFTLYQGETGDGEGRIHFTRMNIYASVELNGMAYYFSFFPVTSFVALSLVLLSICSVIATIVGFGSLSALFFYMTSQKKKISDIVSEAGSEMDKADSTVDIDDVHNQSYSLTQSIRSHSRRASENIFHSLDSHHQPSLSWDDLEVSTTTAHEKKNT